MPSSYGIGAGLQGFVQGATDFFKMYMTFLEMQRENQYKDKILALKKEDLGLRQKESEFERSYKEKLLGLQSQQLQSEADYRKKQAELAKQRFEWQKQLEQQELGLKEKQLGLQQQKTLLKEQDPIKLADSLIDAGKSMFQAVKNQLANMTGNQIILDPEALKNPQKFVLTITELEKLKTGDPVKDSLVDKFINDLRTAYDLMTRGARIKARYAADYLGVDLTSTLSGNAITSQQMRSGNNISQPNKSSNEEENYYKKLLKNLQITP